MSVIFVGCFIRACSMHLTGNRISEEHLLSVLTVHTDITVSMLSIGMSINGTTCYDCDITQVFALL